MQESTSAGYCGDTSFQRTHHPLYSETREKHYECNYCKSTVSSYPSCHNCGEELCQFSNCVMYFEVHSCFTLLNCHPCHKTFTTERHSQQHFKSHVNSGVIPSSNKPLYRISELQQTRFPGTQREFLNYQQSVKPFSSDQYSQQYYYSSTKSVMQSYNVSLEKIPELLQMSFSDSQYELTNSYPLQTTISSDQHHQLNFKSCENSVASRSHEPFYRVNDLEQKRFNSTQKEILNSQSFQNSFSVDQHSQQYYPYTNSVDTKSVVSFIRMPEIKHKIFPCSQCNCNFDHMSHLETHFRIHIGFKPFPCNACGQNFRRKDSSDNHVGNHTDENLFVCDVCNKSFRKLDKLNVHIRTHTSEKPFECEVCNKTFGQKAHLNVHMRTHTGEKPFSCSECVQKFRHQSSLSNHMRTHTGEKPFICRECGQKFRHQTSLNNHMRIHTGEKPFTCNVCGRTFRHRCTLKTHMEIHTDR